MSNQERFFGNANHALTGLMCGLGTFAVLLLCGLIWPTQYTVQCVLITPSGPIKTVEFDDVSVRESDGVVKDRTKVYRLGDHEACLITEKE